MNVASSQIGGRPVEILILKRAIWLRILIPIFRGGIARLESFDPPSSSVSDSMVRREVVVTSRLLYETALSLSPRAGLVGVLQTVGPLLPEEL